jgi:Cu2+-exporting ATPase
MHLVKAPELVQSMLHDEKCNIVAKSCCGNQSHQHEKGSHQHHKEENRNTFNAQESIIAPCIVKAIKYMTKREIVPFAEMDLVKHLI